MRVSYISSHNDYVMLHLLFLLETTVWTLLTVKVLLFHGVEILLTCCMYFFTVSRESYELTSVCSDFLNDDDEGILPPSDVQHPENLVCKPYLL